MIDDRQEPFLLFDEGFPDRVLKTSFLLSLIIIVCSLSYMSLMLTVSITIGCFISLILCKTTWWIIQYTVQHRRTKIKSLFFKISLLKYFVLGALLLSACLFMEVNIYAMAIGLGIVVAVIIMKVGSKLLVNYLNKSTKVPFKNINS